MTAAIESEELTRIGPGSAWARSRLYWIPAAKSSEVPSKAIRSA
jgi:hypothetical protein